MDNYDFNRDGNIRRRGLFSYLLTGVVGAVVGGMLILTFAPAALLEKTIPREDIKQSGYEPPDQMAIVPEKVEISIAALVAKRVSPAVASIHLTKNNDETLSKRPKIESVLSGVIVDKSGYILTNHIADADTASNITVYLSDGRDVPASVVWRDAELDISILRIEIDNLIFAELGKSDGLEAGETVIALGNPLGLSLQRTIARGIVSAVNRTIPTGEDKFMEDLIETDMPVNKNNTGGPLVNSEGKVIGINTAKVKGAEGMGYAVPINAIAPVIKKLVETGEFRTPYIGITGHDKEIAYFYGNRIDKGIFVADIDRRGPFYEAGIRKGDIILEVNEIPVNKVTSLKQNIFNLGAGYSTKVKYQDRHGDIKIVQVIAGPAVEGQKDMSRGDEDF